MVIVMERCCEALRSEVRAVTPSAPVVQTCTVQYVQIKRRQQLQQQEEQQQGTGALVSEEGITGQGVMPQQQAVGACVLEFVVADLVAPYCAIPRDYLSDTPLLRAMGFLMSQHGEFRAIPLPFSERFPLGEHAKWRCDTPPHKRGISAILERYHMRKGKKRAIPPSAILSRKGAIWGGISHWAAKVADHAAAPTALCFVTCMRTGAEALATRLEPGLWGASFPGIEYPQQNIRYRIKAANAVGWSAAAEATLLVDHEVGLPTTFRSGSRRALRTSDRQNRAVNVTG